MLHVEKENLLAATNREIALLRETELRFYIDHIGSIQTMATLLAGFAFTALVQSESYQHLDSNIVLFKEHDADLTERRNLSASDQALVTRTIYALVDDPWKYFSFAMHMMELASVVLCLGEMLQVITGTLIARLLGSRLALRGPDGSIIRATRHLARALASGTRTFFKGLQYFLASVLFWALRGQHPAVALMVAVILFQYWRGQGDLATSLANDFRLSRGVTTAFVDTAADANYGKDESADARADAQSFARVGPGRRISFESGPAPAAPSARSAAASSARSATSSQMGAGPRPWMSISMPQLNPLGSRMSHLFNEVSRDFEGEEGVANGQHKSPMKATQHLISRHESKQQATSIEIEEAQQQQEVDNASSGALGPLTPFMRSVGVNEVSDLRLIV